MDFSAPTPPQPHWLANFLVYLERFSVLIWSLYTTVSKLVAFQFHSVGAGHLRKFLPPLIGFAIQL